MEIDESGHAIRDKAAPDTTNNTDLKRLVEEAAALAERQDNTPDPVGETSAEKKAAMRRKLLGEE